MISEDWQFQLGAGFEFGAGRAARVKDFTSDAEITNHDATIPRTDGTRFGRDTRAGALYTLDGQVRAGSAAAALDEMNRMRLAWRADAVRLRAGAVTYLAIKRPGRDTQRVFGRPRKCTAADHGNLATGFIPFVADFQAVDDLFYGNVERQQSITSAPSFRGGFTFPATFPWRAVSPGPKVESRLDVGGTVATWVCFDIYGPRTNPVITVEGQWSVGLNVTLAAGERITIDPRPWARTVENDTGGYLLGRLTPSSPVLSRLRLAPGDYQVQLGGTDLTNTSYLVARWRDANPGW